MSSGNEGVNQPMTLVKLAGGALGFNWLPVFVADRQGYFARNGVKVELMRMGSVDKATSAVLSGEADLAITPPEGAIADQVKGGRLRIIAANFNSLPLTMVANPKHKRMEDLKGGVLGTSSLTEGTAIYTQEVLASHGLRYPGDYSFGVVGVHPARWKALQDGTIDAAVQPPPFNFMAIDAGYSDLGEVSDYIPEIMFTAMIGDQAWLERNAKATVAVLVALIEATAFLYDAKNDPVLVPIMMEITQSNEAYAQQSLDYMRGKESFVRSLGIPPAASSKTAQLMVKANLLNADAVPLVRKTIDETYASEARNLCAHLL